jgi:hypothetical protein
MSTGIDPIIIKSHEIISKQYIMSDSVNQKKGDVLLLVKVFYIDKKMSPIKIFHLLRRQQSNWMTVEHWILSDEID